MMSAGAEESYNKQKEKQQIKRTGQRPACHPSHRTVMTTEIKRGTGPTQARLTPGLEPESFPNGLSAQKPEF